MRRRANEQQFKMRNKVVGRPPAMTDDFDKHFGQKFTKVCFPLSELWRECPQM
jgi:hypothetical protein